MAGPADELPPGLRIRVQPRQEADTDSEAEAEAEPGSPVVTIHKRARDRVREALVCPYCRDQVVRDDVIACGARTCGALYHRECWEECQQGYGSCAALGCSSTQLREVSAFGFFYRLARLFVAAILFPPRALRAWRETPRDSSIYRDAHKKAKQGLKTFGEHPIGGLFVFLFLTVLSYATVGGVLYSVAEIFGGVTLSNPVLIFCVFFFSPLLVPIFSYLITFQLVLAFHIARATLAGEFSALDRADQGGSYLAQVAASLGKGKA